MSIKIGLQLYTVRDDMQTNFAATLENVASIGYDNVEFAGFFDNGAKQVKKMLDSCGLKGVASHEKFAIISQEPEKRAEFLHEIGAKYAVIPSLLESQLPGGENYSKTKDIVFNISRVMQQAGIELLYHNHDFEFKMYNDKLILDALYCDILPSVLQAEIDTCWVRYANIEPSTYIEKYSGRCPIIHLKDFTADSAKNTNFELGARHIFDKAGDNFVLKPVGQGVLNFNKVIDAALEANAKYFIVEQDNSIDKPAMQAVKESFEYIKNNF